MYGMRPASRAWHGPCMDRKQHTTGSHSPDGARQERVSVGARPIVVVVGTCAALDLALSALEELELGIRLIPNVREAKAALMADSRPLVSAVLIGLVSDAPGALELLRALRARGGLASVPMVVWAGPSQRELMPEAYRAGASSGVLLDGTEEDPVRLARMVHYWAAANEPFTQEAFA